MEFDLCEKYLEICKGETPAVFNGKDIVFKHCKIFDISKIDREKKKSLDWARSRKMISLDQAIQISIKNGKWSQEKEMLLNRKIDSYKMLWSRRGKIKHVSGIKSFHEQIAEMKGEINGDYVERNINLSENCESYSRETAYDYEVISMSYNLDGTRLFAESEIDDLSAENVKLLRDQYSLEILQIDDDFFKRIHVLEYFYSLYDNFSLSPSDFFKKPAYELTVSQSSFLKIARRYNEILKISYDAPEEFHSNFDMMETYAIVKNNGGAESSDATDNLESLEKDINEGREKRGFG